ncbi:MAG: DUF2145 domain-containing protein [Burkholderiaceae bacterium]
MPAAHASIAFCDRPPELNAAQQDRLLRFAALIKRSLDDSGRRIALVARSGMDLGEMGVRYSHAGISLRDSANTAWSVRQLYFACDERRSRLFDQGLSGFVLGLDPTGAGYVSIVQVPPSHDARLADAALDNRIALNLLAGAYSANAYPFSTQYQNCNQWVIEMLAAAWGGLAGGDADRRDDPALRGRAQRWLADSGYQPSLFRVAHRPMIWASAFVPWVHTRDHPDEDVDDKRFYVSMPASIEDFVHARVPGATRTEFCLSDTRIVIRHGWAPIADGCEAVDGDTVVALD